MKYLLIVVLYFCSTPSMTGQQFVIDSLNQLLEKEQDPIRVADIHLGLSRAKDFVHGNSEQLKTHIRIGLELSRKHGYREGEAIALILEAQRKYDEGEATEEIFKSTNRAIQIAQSIPSKSLETYAQRRLAGYFIYDEYDYNTGIEILSKMIDQHDETVSDTNIGNCYKILGLAYEALGQFDLALESMGKALSHFSRVKKQPYFVDALGGPSALDADYGLMNYANVNMYIGRIFQTLGNQEKAFDHLDKAQKIFASGKAHLFEAFVLEEIGYTCRVFGMNEASISAYQKAAMKYEEVEIESDLAYVFQQLGQLFKLEREFATAESFLFKSLAIAEQRADSALLMGFMMILQTFNMLRRIMIRLLIS